MLGPVVAPGTLEGPGWATLARSSKCPSFLPSGTQRASGPGAVLSSIQLGYWVPTTELRLKIQRKRQMRGSCPHSTYSLVGRRMLNKKDLNSTGANPSEKGPGRVFLWEGKEHGGQTGVRASVRRQRGKAQYLPGLERRCSSGAAWTGRQEGKLPVDIGTMVAG